MRKIDVVLGLQWGDEGKGKIVDVLTPEYEIVARFQGGPNAGHTLEFEGMKHVLHTIPSGIFHSGITNVIGDGVVVDPIRLCEEMLQLQTKFGLDCSSLRIGSRASLILPTHLMLDAADELAKGASKIGSTLRGICPTYKDRVGREAVVMESISQRDFMQLYCAVRDKHVALLRHYGYNIDALPVEEEKWFSAIENLKRLDLVDCVTFFDEVLLEGRKALAEGAQGSMLDVNYGTYPFVTSSSTTTGGVCTGLGIAPNRIGRVIGVFKAYCTRVGSGPFATELFGEIDDAIVEIANERGSTTGRRRRTGWLDLTLLKRACIINGVTELAMTMADVLPLVARECNLKTIKACVDYSNGNPVYQEFPIWRQCRDLSGNTTLPQELVWFRMEIERITGIPVRLVSTGPDRKALVHC